MNYKIFDVHAHYGKWFFPIKSDTKKDIYRLLEKYNIENCLLSSSKAIVYDFVEGNKELAQVICNDKKLYGYIVLNPNYEELCQEEIKKYKDHPNFIGTKFHIHYSAQPINSMATKKVLEYLNRFYPCPILVHTYSVDASYQLRDSAREFKELVFIMGHMGGNQWQNAIPVVADTSNIYLEPCCSYMEYDRIKFAIDNVGPARLLFGSDLTLLSPAPIIGSVLGSEISEDLKQKIFYDNAAQIFKI